MALSQNTPLTLPIERWHGRWRCCKTRVHAGDADGELISPCKCMGGQKFVHLSCLRRWQRMVLVSQPTHPAFYKDDARHHNCNVCLAEYSCAPPTRHELMASFTGPEIAAFLEPGCIIGSGAAFSTELAQQIRGMPAYAQAVSSYSHWIRGAYLITAIDVDDGNLELDIDSRLQLAGIKAKLGGSLSITTHGRTYRLASQGSFAGVAESELAGALEGAEAPVQIVLASDAPADCGEDSISAVNLTRPIPAVDPAAVGEATAKAAERYPGVKHVQLEHYNGGPCEDSRIVSCIVPGGSGRGWTVKDKLCDALILALARAARRCEGQGDIGGGQAVRLSNLKARPDLNGEVGITLSFDARAGRWLVRLRNGEGKKLKPANLEPHGPIAKGRVLVFWGDARWTRTQLLGEIARGHWGLCRASVGDLACPIDKRWGGLDGRTVFAPETEMTETFLQESAEQMSAFRAHLAEVRVGDTEEDDD